MRRERGFTLTELLVVIGIAMLVMSMGAIAFNDALKDRRVKGAAAELQAAILSCRAHAVTNGVTIYGYFKPTLGTYGGYSAAGGTDANLIGKRIILPNTVDFITPAANGEITFRPDGTIMWGWSSSDYTTTDFPTNADVKLQEKGGKAAYFDLIKNTGAARFEIR